MAKVFNVNGACKPDRHYMVNLRPRLEEIKAMVDSGAYFTINRARQYGKTTILQALSRFLKADYEVVSLDFQRMSTLSFENEMLFVSAFSEELLDTVPDFPEGIAEKIKAFTEGTAKVNSLHALFKILKLWCRDCKKRIVLIIDEVDTAANNQVFLDFLAQLRAAYLNSDTSPAFHSVILAGVYDVRNITRKIRPEEEHKLNSPWNIAADFLATPAWILPYCPDFSTIILPDIPIWYPGSVNSWMNVSREAGNSRPAAVPGQKPDFWKRKKCW